MTQFIFVHQTRVNTDRYSFHSHGDRVEVVCNVCPDEDELPQLLISTLKAPSYTMIVSVINRHEEMFHRAVKQR